MVVPRDWKGEVPPGRCALRVADPLAALLELAKRRRATWSCPVLAITGSAGKTSVKEMTAHVLAADRRVLRSPGNFNTPIGLSRAILGAEDSPELCVFETGASAPGEIARLAALVRPTSACVTNVSAAHLEGFGSIERVREKKLDLLRAVPAGGTRLVDGDDVSLVAAAERLGGKVGRVGAAAGNDPRLAHVEILADGGTRYRLADLCRGHARRSRRAHGAQRTLRHRVRRGRRVAPGSGATPRALRAPGRPVPDRFRAIATRTTATEPRVRPRAVLASAWKAARLSRSATC